jgi:signal transduction histidine kinase
MPLADVAHPEDAVLDLDHFKELVDGTTDRYQIGKRYLRKDGSAVRGRLTASAVRDSDGRTQFVIGLVEDVTERELLEGQLRQAQKMEAIGQLAGGVAHDFNNLLGIITGYSELLEKDLGPGHRGLGRLQQVRRAADRAAGLTRQLLAFSRKQILQPRVLDLGEVVSDVEKMLRRLIGEDVQVVTVFGPGLGRVMADPGQIEQVLVNLAVNARDAMPGGGKLIVETANADLDEAYARNHAGVVPGRYVLLSVSDTGHGMDAETLSHIFEPFFTTKKEGKGTGLGLATVYGVVKQSGGHVSVYSEPGRGTTFRVYLPRTADQPREEAPPAPEPPPRGTETVMLVEDAEVLRLMMRELLELNGYRVLEIARPEEAAAAAAAYDGEIHLLVTDVVMPNLSGRETAESVRARRPGIRVLYVSGYTDDVITHHGVLEAGTHLLQKPFTTQAFLRKVRDVLDEAPRPVI